MSLRTIFNNAATPPYLPKAPIIVVSTVDDDPTRGDSHGYIGLGRAVADKLGGQYHYIDKTDVPRLDPDHGDKVKAIQKYVNQLGTPDIVFARFSCSDWLSYNNRTEPFFVRDINETLSKRLATDKRIVAHHLTPALFEAEGQKFKTAYPDLRGPLIAAIVTDDAAFGLAEDLIPRIKNLPAATIFICTSRRTSEYQYQSIMRELACTLDASGLTNKIQIVGYDFQYNKDRKFYNPYVGLLHHADHIVVSGNSQSIVSEALATGKRVHLHAAYRDYENLCNKGIIRYCRDTHGQPLQTDHFPPINKTEAIADKIIDQYRHAKQRQLGPMRAIGAYLMDG